MCLLLCVRVQYQLSDNLNFCAMLNLIYNSDSGSVEFLLLSSSLPFFGIEMNSYIDYYIVIVRERVCVCFSMDKI